MTLRAGSLQIVVVLESLAVLYPADMYHVPHSGTIVSSVAFASATNIASKKLLLRSLATMMLSQLLLR